MSDRPAAQTPPRDMDRYYRETSRGLYWEPSYVPKEGIYPQRYAPQASRIHVHNWDQWEDPFRMFYREYVRIQAKKETSYHAIADANQRFEAAKRIDRRWVEGMKLYMAALAQSENFSANLMTRMARFIPMPSFSQAAMYQAMDEMRHGQNDVNYMRWLNKHYDGVDDWLTWFQRHWLFQTARTSFEHLFVSDPFEMVIGVNGVFEAGWTNLLFVATPAVAVANGDVMFGQHQLTTQTDETRHIAIGMTGMRILLEADPRNVPVVQEWFDKWSWLLHRLVGAPTSIFIDYFGKSKVMSYKEAFQHYYLQNYIGGLIEDLGPLGLKPPRFLDLMLQENEIYSHAVWKNLFEGKQAHFHQVEAPSAEERAWFAEKYPLYGKLYEPFWQAHDGGDPLDVNAPPLHCKVCQFPLMMVDAENKPMFRHRHHDGPDGGQELYFCSEACDWIYGLDPEKYLRMLTQDEMLARGLLQPDQMPRFWGLEHANTGELHR
ncbi:hypothetical protein ACFOGJ_14565 [Marinibaculum pumilum]|uniref:Uncharacterized protein n=1 Tax=Marinibaculum pumilum TaxID=1766165 RepID=A0ABV7L1W5_9PROT